jgi:hypothetical protein
MTAPVQTDMRLWSGTKWTAAGHVSGEARPCDHDVPRAQIEMRIVGWLDQRGQVWLTDKDWMEAGGPNGSITPLLIAPGCD